MAQQPTCSLCGDPMPPGEEMFKYHGYSSPCPKPPLPRKATLPDDVLLGFWQSVQGPHAQLTDPLIRFAALIYGEAMAIAKASPEGARLLGRQEATP